MRLILVRHGETSENRLGILQGQMDSTLSDTGKTQAEKVAHRLATEQIGIIYTSDLSRARYTAKEIHRHHSHTPLIATKDLREADFGPLTGKYLKDIDWSTVPFDYENDEKLFERSKKFILSLTTKHRGQTVVCVAHGRINAAIIAFLTGKSHKEIETMDILHNTSVSILLLDSAQWNLQLFNCIRHLEEGLTTQESL